MVKTIMSSLLFPEKELKYGQEKSTKGILERTFAPLFKERMNTCRELLAVFVFNYFIEKVIMMWSVLKSILGLVVGIRCHIMQKLIILNI